MLAQPVIAASTVRAALILCREKIGYFTLCAAYRKPSNLALSKDC